MGLARAHLIIHGRVQGVFFRYGTKDAGVTGWVRNRREGTVEVVAEGERDKVDELVSWCRHGPPQARVTDVELTWEEPTGEFDGFKVAWTA
jgi:acylphosphatase